MNTRHVFKEHVYFNRLVGLVQDIDIDTGWGQKHTLGI